MLTNQAMEDMFEPLKAMGFETLQAFEQVTNSPENVSCPIQPGHTP